MTFESPMAQELRIKVPQSWEVVPLADVTDFQEGPGILAKDFCKDGIPLLRLRNIEGSRVDLTDCNFLNPLKVQKKWPHFAVNEGDFLISTSATLGRVSIVGLDAVGSIPYTGIIRFRSSSPKLDHNFLRAFLSSAAFVGQAQKMATGSVIKHFGPSHLKQMGIMLPSISEQQKIAGIFDVIDDRIALLSDTNVTLEAMARALFKDWFIDFGPVRAKLEGRQPPGLAPEVTALFPDALDEEGRPKGWQSLPLDQVADFLNGLALQKYPGTGEDDLPVIKIAELRSGITKKSGRASMSVPSQYIVEDGDVLFSWSGSLTQKIWTDGRGALNQHLFKVTSMRYPKWLHYFWVDHHLPSFQAIAASKATTMGHIQRHHLTEAKVNISDNQLMAVADSVFGPLFEQITANSIESRSLVNLRDTIIPKLLTGEIRIKNAEQLIGDAV